MCEYKELLANSYHILEKVSSHVKLQKYWKWGRQKLVLNGNILSVL